MELEPGLVLDYGMAVVILLVFYSLFKNELRHLRDSIDRLSRNIERLAAMLEVRYDGAPKAEDRA